MERTKSRKCQDDKDVRIISQIFKAAVIKYITKQLQTQLNQVGKESLK